MPGYRYWVPIIPLFYLLIPERINFILYIKDYKINSNLLDRTTIISISLLLTSSSSLLLNFYPFTYYYGEGINSCNIQLGLWINENTQEKAKIAIGDVGAIPFYSKRETLDIYPQSLQNPYILKNPDYTDYIFSQNITILILSNANYYDFIKNDVRLNVSFDLLFYGKFIDAYYPYEEYIYEIYINQNYSIPNFAINQLLNSSSNFYRK
jgi:hypothetical protein